MKNAKQTTFVAMVTLILVAASFSGVLAQDTITIENGEITIESDDGERMIMMDAESIESLISETLDVTMDGMQDVLAELDEMQLEIRLGDDNQLSFETEDQMWEMNLDVIFSELGSVLETAFNDMDTDGWTGHHNFSDDDFDEEELEEELDRLKDELDDLRRELELLKEI